jgi:hypothetical protein
VLSGTTIFQLAASRSLILAQLAWKIIIIDDDLFSIPLLTSKTYTRSDESGRGANELKIVHSLGAR